MSLRIYVDIWVLIWHRVRARGTIVSPPGIRESRGVIGELPWATAALDGKSFVGSQVEKRNRRSMVVVVWFSIVAVVVFVVAVSRDDRDSYMDTLFEEKGRRRIRGVVPCYSGIPERQKLRDGTPARKGRREPSRGN